MLACWLFFNFAALFDFRCCSLAQEMSFVDHYLPYFRQQLITHPLSTLLPFQSLFTESSQGDILLASPPSPVHLQHPDHSVVCSFSVSSLLFSYLFIFLWGGGSVCPGGFAGLSQGWLWEYCMMLICSPVGLLNVSSSWHLVAREPPCFLSVMCCGEALYGLGVQGVEVLILLGAFFLPSLAPESLFDLWSSHCLLLHSSHHLGSYCNVFSKWAHISLCLIRMKYRFSLIVKAWAYL
jgi:hypothetical protein